MDRNKFSAIAHRNHAFANPISEIKLMKMIGMTAPEATDQVIDIGAGKCELLIRLVENYQVKGTAIELYDGAIDEAKRKAASRIPEDSINYIVEDAGVAVKGIEHRSFDLGICIGSTHALGGLEETLGTLKKLVK